MGTNADAFSGGHAIQRVLLIALGSSYFLAGCGGDAPLARDTKALCEQVPTLVEARSELLAALGAGRGGEPSQALDRAGSARSLARRVGDNLAAIAAQEGAAGSELERAELAMVLVIDQGAFVIDSDPVVPPTKKEFVRIASQIAPPVDDALTTLIAVSGSAEASSHPRCSGLTVSFTPWEDELSEQDPSQGS